MEQYSKNKIALSPDKMAEIDRAEWERTPSRTLMERAGRAVFEKIKDRKEPFAVVCGSGNNAGDGYVIAACLKESGHRVKLFIKDESFTNDGRYFFEKCMSLGVTFEYFSKESDLTPFLTVVDCILGIGQKGDAVGRAAEMIRAVNQRGAYTVSVDINSGLSALSGQGACVVSSDVTYAIGAYKYGHFLASAKDVIKELELLEIGFDVHSNAENAAVCALDDFNTVLRQRKHNSHKGSYGYVTLVGGCTEYSGAIRLANLSLSALRSGCGVCRIACPESICHAVMPHILESTLYPIKDICGAMCFDCDSLDALINTSSAIAVGMGWGRGEQNTKILEYILMKGNVPLVIDADGLYALSRLGCDILKKSGCQVILTPHPLEFSRLINKDVGEILADPIGLSREFAKKYGVTLLLKGCTTVVCDPLDTLICTYGAPGMASAGSGDVLSGVILGLLGCNGANAKTAACGAVICGISGELASKARGDISALARDTVENIPKAVALMSGKTQCKTQ